MPVLLDGYRDTEHDATGTSRVSGASENHMKAMKWKGDQKRASQHHYRHHKNRGYWKMIRTVQHYRNEWHDNHANIDKSNDGRQNRPIRFLFLNAAGATNVIDPEVVA